MSTWAVSATVNSERDLNRDKGTLPEIDAAAGGRISRELSVRGFIEREFFAASLDLMNPNEAGSRKVLELGCGVGHFTALIARRGFLVDAVDRIDAVVHCARERLGGNSAIHLAVQQNETGTAGFGDSEFGFVVALRMLPWLRDPSGLLSEASRVLNPGGMLVLAVRNKNSLQNLIDPATNPLLNSIRSLCVQFLSRVGRRRIFHPQFPRTHSRQEVRELLNSHGFEIVEERSVGVGPLTMFGNHVVPDSIGICIAQAAHWCASRRVPLLGYGGEHTLILARKRKKTMEVGYEKKHE